MKITLVCNCGLLIEQNGQSVLVDAPNSDYFPFPFFSELEKAKRAEPPYDGLKAVLFTHHHPDHYSEKAVKELAAARSDLLIAQPAEQTLQVGCFSAEFHRIAHTPVSVNISHYVLLIRSGGQTVYITADAAPDVSRHREILNGTVADAAFWNGQYLSHPETRRLMLDSAKNNFIYHIPPDEKDVSGIRRKCLKNMERFGAELQTVRLLTEYPSEILLSMPPLF